MKRNVGLQVVGVQMVNASTGAAFTGAVSVFVTGENGTQQPGSGSGVGHKGNGYHIYEPTAAETDHAQVAFTFIGTGAIPATVQLYPSWPQSGDAFEYGVMEFASIDEENATLISMLLNVEMCTSQLATMIEFNSPTYRYKATALELAPGGGGGGGDATSAKQDTIIAKVDAIKAETATIAAKTAQLKFTVTNTVDTNVTHVNGGAVKGTGAPGAEWGPV